MKTAKLLGIGALALAAFSGFARAESFIWTISGGGVNYGPLDGSTWSSTGSATPPPNGNSPDVVSATSDVAGLCTGCTLRFSFTETGFTHITNSPEVDLIDFSGGSFSIVGTLANPGGGSFTGTLLNGTVGAFEITRVGKNYNFDIVPNVTSISFASGLLAAFHIPAGTVTGTLNFNFSTPAVRNDQFFILGAVGGSAGSLALNVAPEPGTWLMLGSGLLVLGLAFRRVRRVN